MQITIDGRSTELRQGATVLDYIKELGLDSSSLSSKPLAARIGGEIFNLGYSPKREAELHLIRFADEEGRRVYERTLRFVLIAAVRKLFPAARVIVQYSLGRGIYITFVKEPELSDEDVALLKEEMKAIIAAAHPLVRRRMDIKEALEYYEKDGQLDKAALLKMRRFSYFDVYRCPTYSDYTDYFYGEMAPNTSYASVFDLYRLGDSLVMQMPDKDAPDVPAPYQDSPRMLAVFSQSDRWGRFMNVANVHDLNVRVENGSIRELVRVNEALHEKNYARVADEIIRRGVKAVMIAGPSSSGKTTSANRIATQLRAEGLDPVMLSLDDYYIDRDKLAPGPDGTLDLEHINALDTAKFASDLKLLLAGEEAGIPRFDFLTQRRASELVPLRLGKDQPLLIEGIHGLNPLMLGDIPHDSVFRIYVSALTTLNLDDHNRIRTTDLRLLRRLVRDYKTRGASMEHTLGMWGSVREGEGRWIFPYQENSDVIINTTLHYEAAVMKRYVYPLLSEVPPESQYYCMARRIVKFLNYFLEADIEDEIPPTSVIREFIGGNSFYRSEDD
ncbi:MAG: nucleoside kinase [Clostridia bacterium]|nr:nucleoside kinase [Clostridia bacterium]